MEKIKSSIGVVTASESELNNLFKEILDGIRDDLIESQQNVDMYLAAIENETGGKELYGPLYNDALKIKNLTRERQLKFLNMLKDRVGKKEQMNFLSGKKDENDIMLDHSEINKILSDLNKKPTTSNIQQLKEVEEDGELDYEDMDDDHDFNQ